MTYRRSLVLAAGLAALSTGVAHAQAVDTDVADVIVRGAPLRHGLSEVATPVASLTGEALVHRRQATIGETLQGLPGVNADTFGGGASRPVIRGQAAPRVKVLADSAEVMDASQVSPDHAVVAEPLLLKGVEVFRGPSALVFGGGAIAGAVNLIDERVPTAIPERGVEGVAEIRAGDNGAERAGVMGVTVGGGAFAAHAEAVRRTSGDYETPLGVVEGSFNDTSTLSFGGSWIGARGYLGGAFTLQRSGYGLPGHAHQYEACHLHGLSLHCDDHEPEEGSDHDHEEAEAPPVVALDSQRLDLRGEVSDPLPGLARLRLRASRTDYQHQEIEDGAVATTFRNDGQDLRLEAEHVPLGPWSGVVGLQLNRSDFSALGEEAFLPASRTQNAGVFVFEEAEWNAWHVELAARQERQEITGDGVAATRHDPLSLSGSVRWTFVPGWSAALAISRSQRAPTAQELYADGVHIATNTLELGDAALTEETARTVDLTLRKTDGDTTLTLGVFRHEIDDYVFADTLDQFEAFRLIRYTQKDAEFSGLDGEVTHRFNGNLSATAFGDYVRARLADGGDLPRIPAARLGARVNGAVGPVSGELEYFHVFDQDRVAAFEQATPGYDMVNATLSYRLPQEATNTEVYVRGSNLADETALNHASFISRAAPLRGRTFVVGMRTAF
jgi:iron complex outermembrane receptor protein